MGIAFKDLFVSKEISLDDLKGKILIIDSFNLLYQFLTTIRGRDGSLFTDSKGKVTSHLIGLFSRVSRLLEKDIKPAFVFDGKPPELKKQETKRRKELKIEAEKKYNEAVIKDDISGMKKYAGRTTRLTPELIEEAKKLISAFGLPIIQAESEGEAQAAYMVKKGDGYAVLSQDFDSLVHGAPRVLRNVSITGKRKKAGKLKYETVKPELINLSENLNKLGIDKNQLIALGMLVGTDYNRGGIKGIGPKNALKLVKKYNSDLSSLFEDSGWENHFEISWQEVYYQIKNMPLTDDYKLEYKEIDEEKIKSILIEEHEFSRERVEKTLNKITKTKEFKKQKGLNEFF